MKGFFIMFWQSLWGNFVANDIRYIIEVSQGILYNKYICNYTLPVEMIITISFFKHYHLSDIYEQMLHTTNKIIILWNGIIGLTVKVAPCVKTSNMINISHFCIF